jgi:hypothetical protein
MKSRRLNENDVQKIVSKVVEEGSTWEGIKGWFRGRGYNYSKYLSEIDDVLYSVKKKLIDDQKLKNKLDGISEDLKKSSAEDWQKDELTTLMDDLSDTISKTNNKLQKLATRIKKMR